ncbi:MAG TPA: prolyl oligopeptidase family serine peptidase [Pyrinomonadaceae bacterium]|jgi:dipeptidyl aminopeptidase/acylaminoacyl peptidase|nr:prolyl oligopeptidase family serine peptidase [Pyrinomonadaceae bacterium]
MKTRRFCVALSTFVLLCLTTAVTAQQGYKKPPKEVLDILNAPTTPGASVSPTRDNVILSTGLRYPPLADLAQPVLRIAGRRINPQTNSPFRFQYSVGLTLKRIADGSEIKIETPLGAKISGLEWSDNGKHFAFLNTTSNRVEAWVGDAATGKIRNLRGFTINSAVGNPLGWLPDNRTLLVQLVPANRGAAPAEPAVPPEPNTQESSGRPGPVRTYEDLLKSPHDEDLFEYYATAQLALVDTISGRATPFGQPAIFLSVDAAPDGHHLLVTRVHRPFSYLFPDSAFPRDVEVWDTKGKLAYKVASLPLADQVPINGVTTGPRSVRWRPTEPATLVWVKALDDGDPRKKVANRDSVLTIKAPFTGEPVELFKTEHRFTVAGFGEKGGLMYFSDFDREKRWQRTFVFYLDKPDVAPKEISSRNQQDRYSDPGTPVTRVVGGQRAILQNGDFIYLIGNGASPEGDRPFLDRLNLQTLKTDRIFRSDADSYETVVALLSDDATKFLTRRESPTQAPNYFVRTVVDSVNNAARAFTNFPDPTPQLRGIKKQLITYKRADGVQCSFTLYLPPNYKPGTRLPTVVWAYPLEFTDAGTASQVTGSSQRATSIGGPSHLFFLLEGYAVLDDATMPIVGTPETVNNTYVEQITMSAKAAIDKAVELGVTDPDRVGVGGHSYGAFMTANLLAHTDLFRAGIARSGAYNRTLTPFGFQNERRTLWEAPEMYLKVSPFMYATKINEPLLMTHGEADDNTGTFPIQSERMYQALKGQGATVRLVMLPHEAHGYAGRESIEHVLYEMITWFDKYVKNAPPRTKQDTSTSQKVQ